MLRILVLILVLVLVFNLSGCAGLAVGTYGKKESVKTQFSLAKARNQFSYNASKGQYSKADIVEHCGSPDDNKVVDNCEVLIFDNGTSWAGAGAFVGVVPVPLAVPSGTYKNRFYVRNGLVLGLVQEYGEVDRAAGYMCGSNKCDTISGEKVNEPTVDAGQAINEWCD